MEVQLHTHSGNEVGCDRFLCELEIVACLIDARMTSPRESQLQMHTMLRVESLVSQVE